MTDDSLLPEIYWVAIETQVLEHSQILIRHLMKTLVDKFLHFVHLANGSILLSLD